jgi:hypothetical protein
MGGTMYLSSLTRAVQVVRSVRTWQLLVVLFFSVFLAATLLRLNNLGMIERREAVIATKAALVELQHYVGAHMNTNLGGGVYLEQAYQADRAKALEAATDTTNPNSQVYQQASVECQSRFVGGVASFRNDYVRCVIDKVASLQQGKDIADSAQLPRLDNYRYNFLSPLISFDAAGLTVLFCGAITGVIVVRLLTKLLLALVIRRRYREA